MMEYGLAELRPGSRRMQSIALTAILIIGAAARCTHLFSHATTPDEAFTFFIASHPLHQIVVLLQTGDFHPPLVYLIGHALFHLTSQVYLFRIVSVAFGVMGIAASYALASYVTPRWALLTALLVALCPSLVFFDRFFRMYAMLWPLCAASWAALLWALADRRKAARWALYALTLTLLLYTQYLAFFTIAAQVLYVLLFARKLLGFWLALGAAAMSFVPWLPVLVQQYPLGGSAYSALRGHLSQMILAPAVMLLDGLPANLEYNLSTSLVLWLVMLVGLVLAVLWRRWLAIALCLPVALQVAYSLVSGKLLLGQRYLLQGVAPALILITLVIAWLAATRARVLGLILAAALLVMMVFGTVDELFLSPYQPIDWTVYGRFLDARVRPDDAVVFDGAMAYYPLVGTRAASGHVYLVAGADDLARISRALRSFPRVWYIDYQSQLPDPQHEIFASLAHSHPQRTGWRTTQAAYGDAVFTTLFVWPAAGAKRGP
jgi:uncharacterized membrane protein